MCEQRIEPDVRFALAEGGARTRLNSCSEPDPGTTR